MKIVSSAPCRISLVGGGTDVNPFAFEHGGAILNLAVNLRHTATLIPHAGSDVTLEALGEERTFSFLDAPLPYDEDRTFDLLRAVINHFRIRIPSGFSLQISGPSSNPLGLGRSGSVATAAIGAFDAWVNANMSRKEIGLLASALELKELGWPGGKQDPLVASFGGINVMSFGPGDGVDVRPLQLSDETLRDLRRHAFIFYIGGYRHSSDQQTRLIQGMSREKETEAMVALRDAVAPASATLERGDWPVLGRILHQGWEDKKKSNPGVSSGAIDEHYDLALRCGAYGGKICGAGGAGNMFFLIPPERKDRTIAELVRAGAQSVDFGFDLKGLTVESYDH